MPGQDDILPLSRELASRPAPERRGRRPSDWGPAIREPFNPHRPVEEGLEIQDLWLSKDYAPKIDTAKKDVTGEIMRMNVKDGEIIILRVPRNFSKMAINSHIKNVRVALKERGINASIAVILKEVDIVIMSHDEENILGVDMTIE